MDSPNVDGFLFPGPIWFIAPPPFLSIDEICETILAGFFEDGETSEMIPVIFTFSDRDLAQTFIEKSGKQADAYPPFDKF